MTESTVFDPAGTGYAAFRIPAVVRSGGVLLAFCEGRRDSAADNGPIDIVLRRSPDGGEGWGPLQVVASAPGRTVGNPAPVAVPDSPIVVLLSVQNAATATEADILAGRVGPQDGRRVFVQISRDGGAHFERPHDITAGVKRPGWGWYATGPGHGIALRSGRLLVPANHSILPGAGEPPTPALYGGHCLYSDDCRYSDDAGRTWTIGYVDDGPDDRINANESTAAELPDGTVYLNARNQGGTAEGTRVDAYSADGGATLSAPFRPQPHILSPVVQGSVLQWSGTTPAPLLYSGPCDPAQRRRMAIHISQDGGRRWRLGAIIGDRPAAYSDLVQLDTEVGGVLYETGADGPYETIRFRRFGLAGLLR